MASGVLWLSYAQLVSGLKRQAHVRVAGKHYRSILSTMKSREHPASRLLVCGGRQSVQSVQATEDPTSRRAAQSGSQRVRKAELIVYEWAAFLAELVC